MEASVSMVDTGLSRWTILESATAAGIDYCNR